MYTGRNLRLHRSKKLCLRHSPRRVRSRIKRNEDREADVCAGFSYYPRRVLYQTHEVTELLREGENTLTVYLGQGWYCGRFLCENQTQIYGEQPAVAWILELEDAAGSRRLVSDETVENWNPRMNMPESTMVRFFCRRKRESDRSCGCLHEGDAVCTGADAYGGASAG